MKQHIAEWEQPDLDVILAGLGFRQRWSTSGEDADGQWLTILTSKERQ